MRGGVLLLRTRIDVAFRCDWAHAALRLNGTLTDKLCKNDRTWFAKGDFVRDDLVRVSEGGNCPGCGFMGRALLQDENTHTSDGRVVTVEVAG